MSPVTPWPFRPAAPGPAATRPTLRCARHGRRPGPAGGDRGGRGDLALGDRRVHDPLIGPADLLGTRLGTFGRLRLQPASASVVMLVASPALAATASAFSRVGSASSAGSPSAVSSSIFASIAASSASASRPSFWSALSLKGCHCWLLLLLGPGRGFGRSICVRLRDSRRGRMQRPRGRIWTGRTWRPPAHGRR